VVLRNIHTHSKKDNLVSDGVQMSFVVGLIVWILFSEARLPERRLENELTLTEYRVNGDN